MKEENAEMEEEKENVFGNMIIEPELEINAENNINNENIPSFENQQNKKKEYNKKKKLIPNKTKTYSNTDMSKSQVPSSAIQNANKPIFNITTDNKGNHKKGFKCKNKKDDFDQCISKNDKIDQSNLSLNNQQIEYINHINSSCTTLQKINQDDKIKEMNIDNQENNINIINNNNIPHSIINISNTINENNENKGDPNKEEEEEEMVKPSLTWNKVNDSNSSFIPMEYMNEIWDSFISKEDLNNYSFNAIIEKQNDIKDHMRSMLVDWLISLQNGFFLNSKTLFLAVNLIDRYLSQRQIFRTRFQLLGITALFIAAKYEEIYMKTIEDYVNITAKAFDKYEILEMESELIDLVDFNLSLPLSIDFFGLLGSLYKFNSKEFRLGHFLLEAYLLSLNCCNYKQRQIALAACYIILALRKMENLNPNNEKNFVKYYCEIYKINFDIWNEYSLIIECAKNMYEFFERRDEVKYREIYKIFRDLFN